MPSKSIKAMVQDINNKDADGGGLWLPNIQRQFVWEEDQIERLFDSIMRQYPLSSMLIWKTRDEIKHRSFIQNYNDGKTNLKGHYQHNAARLKRLVLDGQQRLQSLYLGLRGAIDGRVLHFNLLSGDKVSTDDKRYRFKFLEADRVHWPWVRVPELVFTNKLPEEIILKLLEEYDIEIDPEERLRVTINISRARHEFSNEAAVLYQEIDNSYEDNGLTFEDVVEVFIRANSGGTKLGKSDLMFTLLTTEWGDADVEFEDFLDEINDNGRFHFTRDFIIKLSTTVLGYGAKYDVDKLRDDAVRKDISENWLRITESLRFVKDEIVKKTYIRSGKALVSYNAIIPLVYAHYHFPEKWGQAKFLPRYLIRVLLSGAFSGQPDGVIDQLISVIKQSGGFNLVKVFSSLEGHGRNIHVGQNKLLYGCGYGTGNIHLVFNLLYGQEYKAASIKNEPQVDHIFARSLLKNVKEENEETGRMVQVYSKWDMDQLANCMLLTAKENGAGDKSDKPLYQWLKDKDEDFLEIHCIPNKKALWKPDRFDDFIEARKELLLERFRELEILEEEEEWQE